MKELIIIFFVQDQFKSKEFYKKVLQIEPVLDVPGMTEFMVFPGLKLGIMPAEGMHSILKGKISHPSLITDVPKSELYITVDNPSESLSRAIEHGAKLISNVESRNWGDDAGYCMDSDGYIIAFAKKTV
jgi:uncharacterized glyoxalase superfamily protein PhnB